MDKHYTVRQASEMTGVKAYVLRYWEEEMGLRIERNELGHRCYTGYDIQLFLNIKELKSRGLQLRAIRDLIPKIAQTPPGSARSKIRLLENGENEEEPKETPEEITEIWEETEEAEPEKGSEKILEFQQILERLIAQELLMKNEEEERCRTLDAAIRRQQLARKEAAAASADRRRRKSRRRKGG